MYKNVHAMGNFHHKTEKKNDKKLVVETTNQPNLKKKYAKTSKNGFSSKSSP